jgi:hypothetical protein
MFRCISAFTLSLFLLLILPTSCFNAHGAQVRSDKQVPSGKHKRPDELAYHSYWLQLNHYRSGITSTWKSEIDSPHFFLAPNGKRNPLAELQATLAAFGQIQHSNDLTEKYRGNVCRFPARFNWLKQKLAANWPEVDCVEMQQWQAIIQPKGMTLVFPTAFMNNPSSMFGHTLLRIDAKDQTRNKELVAFSVNFAALPDPGDNAATFAFKGMTGQYPAAFSLMPYYRKVREYNDLESRDMWEYKLDFSELEVNNILLHIWELKDTEFDYYFLDENCSYQLLSLLQLAREDLDLTNEFSYHVIPSDTVAVLRDKGLLSKPRYRPAFGTKLLHYSDQLTDKQLGAAKLAMQGEYPSAELYSASEQAAILEMAYEWLNYQFYAGGLERGVTAPQLTQLLIKRSKIKFSSPFDPVPEPQVSPEQGHGSARFGFGFTGFNYTKNALTVSWRMNYHDLFDAPGGFIPGAQISFMDTELSLSELGASRLEHLYLLDAMSLPPDNAVFDSWSWNIRAGFDRQPDVKSRRGRWFAQGGYGKSWGDPNCLHGFLLASAELNTGAVTYRDVEVGAGIETGLIWQAASEHRLGLLASQLHLFDSDVDYRTKASFNWQWSPVQAWGFRAEAGYLHWRGEESYGKLQALYYF